MPTKNDRRTPSVMTPNTLSWRSSKPFLIFFILLGITIMAETAIPAVNTLSFLDLPAFASASPHYSSHIVFIIMENHPLSSVTCSGCAPYMMSLGNSYATSTNYVGPVSSSWNPSLPNYLGLISGETWGCTSDALPNSGGCTTAPWTCSSPCNLVDRFSKAGISWKGYMEGMRGSDICNGNGGSDGGTDYVAHHNPFVYFGNIVNNSTRCSLVVPSGLSGGATSCGASVTTSVISNLVTDLNGTAPNFSWVTPNTIDDSHSGNCGVQQANNWLSIVVPAILTTKTFETDVSATVIITFDEPTTGAYGTTPVYFVVAGPGAKLHYTSSTKFTHLNWLATLESNWSLSCLVSGNDCGAAVMSEFFASQSPPGGFCLQCLLNTLSSASLLPVWIAISVSLIASAVILARRRFRASPMSSTPHKNQLRIEQISSSWFVGLNSPTETRMLRSDPVELRDS